MCTCLTSSYCHLCPCAARFSAPQAADHRHRHVHCTGRSVHTQRLRPVPCLKGMRHHVTATMQQNQLQERLSVHLTSSSPLDKLRYSQHIEYNSAQHEERYVPGRAQTHPSQRGPTHRQWKGPRGQPMTGLPRDWPPPRGIPQIQSCVAMPSPSQALEDRVRGVAATQTQKYASERRTGDGAGECLARAGHRSVWQDGGGRVSRLEHRPLAHAGKVPGSQPSILRATSVAAAGRFGALPMAPQVIRANRPYNYIRTCKWLYCNCSVTQPHPSRLYRVGPPCNQRNVDGGRCGPDMRFLTQPHAGAGFRGSRTQLRKCKQASQPHC